MSSPVKRDDYFFYRRTAVIACNDGVAGRHFCSLIHNFHIVKAVEDLLRIIEPASESEPAAIFNDREF